jgi:hypothetical protein
MNTEGIFTLGAVVGIVVTFIMAVLTDVTAGRVSPETYAEAAHICEGAGGLKYMRASLVNTQIWCVNGLGDEIPNEVGPRND